MIEAVRESDAVPAAIEEKPNRKIFTLDEARLLLPRVRKLTTDAVNSCPGDGVTCPTRNIAIFEDLTAADIANWDTVEATVANPPSVPGGRLRTRSRKALNTRRRRTQPARRRRRRGSPSTRAPTQIA